MAGSVAKADVRTKSTGHGEFLRQWEANSPLSQKQQDLCLEIENSLATDHFQVSPFATFRRQTSQFASTLRSSDGQKANEEKKLASSQEAKVEKEEVDTFGDPLEALEAVKSAEDFRSWYEKLERRLDDANEQKYHNLIEGLREGKLSSEELQKVLETSQQELQSVKAERERVAETTDRFRAACESLVSERKRHVELADTLRRRLTYFEELETLSVKFGNGKEAITPTSPDFVRLLHRLDECVAYASSSTGAVAEADGYLARFLELQRRAFTIIRDHTISSLKAVTQQVSKEVKSETPGRILTETDLTDASKEYLRFRTVAPKVKLLMTELYARTKEKTNSFQRGDMRPPGATATIVINPLFSTRNFAINLLGDCEECFTEQRRILLESSVSPHLKILANEKTIIDFARLGSSYVLQLCHVESQLYEHFFCTESEKESPALNALLSLYCGFLYEEMRSCILRENDLDTLVYLIELLRTEILGIEAPKRGGSGEPFSSAVTRCIADAQERVIYRAEIYMRDEIKNFSPTPADLDYPDIIIGNNTSKNTSGSAGGKDTEPVNKQSRPRSMYSTWYPPVEKTLRLLSMLYRCVGGQVFAGIAQEAVAMCVECLRVASAKIRGSGKESAETHAELFLIWHLLMLREQTSPFDVDFAYADKELDFKELRSLLGDVIRGQASIRMLATPPAAMRERVIDSKLELERGYFTACEAFVLRLTRTSDPILSFLVKCNAHPAKSITPTAVPPSPSMTGLDRKSFESLKQTEGSDLHPASVRKMWENMEATIDDELTSLVKMMKVYITKASSCSSLLKPVRANISQAFSELLTALQTRYTLEEREEISINGEKVEILLGKMDEIMGLANPSTHNGQHPQA